MSAKKQLTITEFSRLTGIKCDNLRYYDRIGLLCPDMRGDNKYRYYSRHQLNSAFLITSLRTIGVSIEDIKTYTKNHTPEDTLALFSQQDKRIQEEIRQRKEMRQILQTYSNMVKGILEHGEHSLFIEMKEREPIFLCPVIPDSMDDDEAGIMAYNYAEAHGINAGYPCGTIISKSRIDQGSTQYSEHFFFKTTTHTNDAKPAGLYAVIYDTCVPWNTKIIYEILQQYIDTEGLEIIGPAYEEYPMEDSISQGMVQCCVRIEIPVRYKTKE